MKMYKLFSLFSLLLILTACGDNETRTVEGDDTSLTQLEYQDPDEAIINWPRAWNSNDVNQVQAQTADDVVVVLNGREVSRDSIAGFIQAAGSAMKDLQLNSLKKGSTETIVYDTGTFTHTYTDDTTRYQGTYTFIWEREEGETEWKVKAMNITDFQPER